ncbi:Nif3-like dinuclear metal center hexameric protein [Gleimia sp. 6138-11-ORH1]|uniref:Nif3-like dinuclear metal center hexameric protein n=1 Tax=Gleimia sp. 6138-11-ORH1 TaxID=2973937 RepID=UPI0021675466|nr:Nif3-like dinuclear metal center hexameric protein [Gleimia sp. 6138-11-ORH1]MCS4484945.1 Nif3-like dinuclear metal center hexameric protein [Gleimia sp. 6138-11-ORH1]
MSKTSLTTSETTVTATSNGGKMKTSPNQLWKVKDLQAHLNRLYPPHLQEEWDKNGLIVGDLEQPVQKILLAIDPVPETIAQAVEGNYDLLITHHPLFLKGINFISKESHKGRMVHDLIKNDVALLNAHTNADSAERGVAWALAKAVGITGTPFSTKETSETGTPLGLGRIGKLPRPIPLETFAQQVARALPSGPHGIFVGVPTGKDLQMPVETVAVSGGSGDSFLQLAADLGADVYLTADLRHHPAQDHLNSTRTALISGSHWATEWLWLPALANDLELAAQAAGVEIEIDISASVTEPWRLHLPTQG